MIGRWSAFGLAVLFMAGCSQPSSVADEVAELRQDIAQLRIAVEKCRQSVEGDVFSGQGVLPKLETLANRLNILERESYNNLYQFPNKFGTISPYKTYDDMPPLARLMVNRIVACLDRQGDAPDSDEIRRFSTCLRHALLDPTVLKAFSDLQKQSRKTCLACSGWNDCRGFENYSGVRDANGDIVCSRCRHSVLCHSR